MLAAGFGYPATISAEAAFGARYAEYRNRALAGDRLIRGELLLKLDLDLAGAYESTLDSTNEQAKDSRLQKIEAEFTRLLRELSGRIGAKQRIVGAQLTTEGEHAYGRLVLAALPGSEFEEERLQAVYFGYRVRPDGSFEMLSGLP